jgi:hypothetical protein
VGGRSESVFAGASLSCVNALVRRNVRSGRTWNGLPTGTPQDDPHSHKGMRDREYGMLSVDT